MPIPVSATGFANAAGAQVQAAEELATAGPFARLSSAGAGAAAAPQAAPQAAHDAAAAPPTAAVEVRELTFAFCGLDGRPLDGVPPVVRDASFSLAPTDRVLLLGASSRRAAEACCTPGCRANAHTRRRT